MSIRKLASFFYKTARLLGDVNAARKGTLHKRIANRTIGKKLF